MSPANEPDRTGSPGEARDYISPAEFVSVTGISMSTVRRYLRSGQLPKIQPGGHRCRVLIPRDALESYRNQTAVPEDTAKWQPETNTKAVDSSGPTNAPNYRGQTPRWMGRC